MVLLTDHGPCGSANADALVANPQNQKPDGLVELIEKKGGEVTVRDIQRSSRRWSTAAAAEAGLENLVQAGLACRVDRPGTGKGGRPTSVYRLLTHVDADTTS